MIERGSERESDRGIREKEWVAKKGANGIGWTKGRVWSNGGREKVRAKGGRMDWKKGTDGCKEEGMEGY